MTWFDPTAHPAPGSTAPQPVISGPEPDPTPEPDPSVPHVSANPSTESTPGRHAAPVTATTASDSSTKATQDHDAEVGTIGRHARVTPVVDGRSRRRRLAAAALLAAAAVAFLCWPRGDGYTPSLPGFSDTTAVESSTTTPTGVEAARIDQDAASKVWNETGSWTQFAPVSGNVTWITSAGTIVVFRSEDQCYVYGVVDGAPTTVQTQPVSACSTAAVGEASAQLGQVAGSEVRVTTISADVDTATDQPAPTTQSSVVGTDAGTAAQVMYDVGRQAQQWAQQYGTFEGFSSKKVVVMYATANEVSFTTNGATGCPAVLVNTKTITPTC